VSRQVPPTQAEARKECLATLSRRLAEIVGDMGFEVGTCPQKHTAKHFDTIGTICFICATEAARSEAGTEPNLSAHKHYRAWLDDMVRRRKAILADPGAHPEWRIERGPAWPYAERCDLLEPIERAFARQNPAHSLTVTVHQDGSASAAWSIEGVLYAGAGLIEAEARCDALLTAIERLGWRPAAAQPGDDTRPQE